MRWENKFDVSWDFSVPITASKCEFDVNHNSSKVVALDLTGSLDSKEATLELSIFVSFFYFHFDSMYVWDLQTGVSISKNPVDSTSTHVLFSSDGTRIYVFCVDSSPLVRVSLSCASFEGFNLYNKIYSSDTGTLLSTNTLEFSPRVVKANPYSADVCWPSFLISFLCNFSFSFFLPL